MARKVADPPTQDSRALGQARGERWRTDPLTSIEQAGQYVDRLGFTLLFPMAALPLSALPAQAAPAPSLWEAVAGEDAVPFAEGMGEAEATVWTWKDELPKTGLAWYGKFLYKRASLLSPRLLAALYAGQGEPDDHEAYDLSPTAHRIAEALLLGPLPSSALREIVGDRARYDRAITELQRELLVTSAGTREQRAGWPAGVVELTCRLFDVGGRFDRASAVACFRDTMVQTTPRELAKAFGWPLAAARTELEAGSGNPMLI